MIVASRLTKTIIHKMETVNFKKRHDEYHIFPKKGICSNAAGMIFI